MTRVWQVYAESSQEFLASSENTTRLQQIHSQRVAQHKALSAKERAQPKPQESPEVGVVVEQAWQSDVLAAAGSSPAGLEGAVTEVHTHQTTLASFEARKELERWLLNRISAQ